MTTTVSRDELVNVDHVTNDEPVFHKMSYDQVKGNLTTFCGSSISFRVKSPLLPFKHAKLFAVACPKCFSNNGESDGQ